MLQYSAMPMGRPIAKCCTVTHISDDFASYGDRGIRGRGLDYCKRRNFSQEFILANLAIGKNLLNFFFL